MTAKSKPKVAEKSEAYRAIVKQVSDFVNGGTWAAAWELAKVIDPTGSGDADRSGFKELAIDLGWHVTTLQKWVATLMHAAAAGLLPSIAEIQAGAEFDLNNLGMEQWQHWYKKACASPPPWNPSGRALEPRSGSSRHVSKKMTFEQMLAAVRDNPELLAALIKGDPAAIRKAREALRDVDKERAALNAQTGDETGDETISDPWGLVLKVAGGKRYLKELFTASLHVQGETDREMMRAGIAEMRMLLDGIELNVNGESMDAELVALLDGIS